MYKYITQNRRKGRRIQQASCNPSFPQLLNQQPVNTGTCIPLWKNHRQLNSWTPPLCLTKNTQTNNKTKTPQTNKQKIPTTPIKTTKKPYLKITLHNNLVTKISSTITERLNLFIDLKNQKNISSHYLDAQGIYQLVVAWGWEIQQTASLGIAKSR